MFTAPTVGSKLADKFYIAADKIDWHSRFGYSPETSIHKTPPLEKRFG